MAAIRWLSAVLFALILAGPAAAQPLERSVREVGGEVRFQIRFEDANRVPHVLDFALPAARYRAAAQGLVRLDSPEVQGRVEQAVQAQVARHRAAWRDGMAARLDALGRTLPDGIALDYEFDGTQLAWRLQAAGVTRGEVERVGQRVRARIERASRRLRNKAQNALQTEAAVARTQVYEELDYVRDSALDGLLRPDYRGIARDAADLLRPLSDAIAARAGTDARARTALALAFLQSIPYDPLRERGATDGTGFAVPAELLKVNRGDCDSKATALAALLHTLAPEVDTALLLLPGHAVLAAELEPQPGDSTRTLRGRRFVLMEPAGPGLYPVGRVARSTADMLEAGKVLATVWLAG